MIEKGEHLMTDKIVSIDVEYGGARTVPRIAVTSFNDEVLYYSDFCLRYEDWIETKLTQSNESEAIANGVDAANNYQPLVTYSEKQPNSTSTTQQEGNDEACANISDDEDLKAEIEEFKNRVENPQFYEDFNSEADGASNKKKQKIKA